jgi:hypothetical protein
VQRGYRGHVRIEDAVAVTEPSLLRWELAPLANPKPSAGQFYLAQAQRKRIGGAEGRATGGELGLGRRHRGPGPLHRWPQVLQA